MSTLPGDNAPLRFSTASFSERERPGVLREVFGRKLSRTEMQPLCDEIHADVTARCVGGIHFVTIDHSLMKVSRTRELVADGDDALILHVVGGGCQGSQLGREIAFRSGDAGLIPNGDACSFTCFGTTLLVKLAYRDLRPLMPISMPPSCAPFLPIPRRWAFCAAMFARSRNCGEPRPSCSIGSSATSMIWRR